MTTAAVTSFQEAHDLAIDGVLGPRTEETLREILRAPTSDRIERVKALQRQLSRLGFQPGAVDGRYGPLTTDAVTRFQQAHGLRVDGLVGRVTAEALAQAQQSRLGKTARLSGSCKISPGADEQRRPRGSSASTLRGT